MVLAVRQEPSGGLLILDEFLEGPEKKITSRIVENQIGIAEFHIGSEVSSLGLFQDSRFPWAKFDINRRSSKPHLPHGRSLDGAGQSQGTGSTLRRRGLFTEKPFARAKPRSASPLRAESAEEGGGPSSILELSSHGFRTKAITLKQASCGLNG